MVFSSLVFLAYFLPITIIVYFLFSFSLRLQNVWLLITSLVFYAWGEPKYVLIMLMSIIANWFFGLIIGRHRKNDKLSKAMLIIAIIFNLGVLLIFKYLDFFIDNINAAVGRTLFSNINLALPIGISFFTFQAMSYVIDIYRNDAEYQVNPLYMGLYVAFFPQLVAGPIVRYNTIAEYIKNRKTSIDDVSKGVNRFAIGLIKKVLIANNLAVVVDEIYDLVNTGRDLYETPAVLAWVAVIGYMLQIYFDFSSYSDMAIGLGRIFGFKFEENFNYPYISKSIGEFWRRWHISLGTWFKEYVYFPLGGSRVENQDLMVKNTLIVWILTGMWHGAAWTFILWGLYNFIFIICERAVGFEKAKIANWIKLLYATIVVLFGWILFRSETIYQFREMILDLFMANRNCFVNDTAIWVIKEYLLVFIAAIVFSTPVFPTITNWAAKQNNRVLQMTYKSLYIVILSAGVILSVASLVRGGYNPFIYFNF